MKEIKLLQGEVAHIHAPKAKLPDGNYCIPQHYLQYEHTISSIEDILINIEYSKRYPVFVSEDNSGIYIQVGIVGVDNYIKAKQEQKIVYGRKWRVETNLPTSEVIQTTFLAIKKAREHEVRELFSLMVGTKKTTPFNTHHDLPLLVKSNAELHCESLHTSSEHLIEKFKSITYDHASFSVQNIEVREAGYTLIELTIQPSKKTTLPELFSTQVLVLIVEEFSFNAVLHQLMTKLIHLSDQNVNENFTYDKVARFSEKKSVSAIAAISAKTRSLHKTLDEVVFIEQWLKANYETDLTRAPKLTNSSLGEKIRKNLEIFSPLAGVPPK